MPLLIFGYSFSLLLATLLTAPSGTCAQSVPVDEYQMKALYLFNFAQFVEWPAAAFTSASDAINICIAGENPFGSLLRQTVANKQTAGRRFKVREIRTGPQIASCHLLFVPTAEKNHQKAILASTRGLSVLTVGEGEDFLRAGGIIALRLKGGRLRFDIALEAANAAQLKISSKLLHLADSTSLAGQE